MTFLQRSWPNPENSSQVAGPSDNPVGHFDGAGSEPTETDFLNYDLQPDHETRQTQHFSNELESMDTSPKLDAVGQSNDGAGVGSGERSFTQHDGHQGQYHDGGDLGLSITEEDRMETSMTLDADHQFGDQAGGFETASLKQEQDQHSMQEEYENEQKQPSGSELESDSRYAQSTARVHEGHGQFPQTLRTRYDIGSSVQDTLSGHSYPSPFSAQDYIQQSQHARSEMSHIRNFQGPQNLGYRYGSPTQHPMTIQDSNNDSYYTKELKIPDPRQGHKFISFPQGGSSGHAHLSASANRPAFLNEQHRPLVDQLYRSDRNNVINLRREYRDDGDDTSDDEPLQTRGRLYTAPASHRSSPTKSQPSVEDPSSAVLDSNAETADTGFDFKLPSHEVLYENTPDGEPFAKVSLPGLVREAVLLSPDHSNEEFHLFINVFLPSHLNQPTPDAEPALAVLNFHTIAVLVIETYHLLRDIEGKDPKGLDIDEVFFQVMDKWRVGMMSGKEGYKLLRGVQEFCDLALDLLFWVKEHGLGVSVPEAEKKERKERSDKGTKREKKPGGASPADTVRGAKKAMVPPPRKENTLLARKKEKPKEKKKKKPSQKEKKEGLGKITVYKPTTTGRVEKRK
ncbi:hypothetical protein K505DRAFT_364413 [Melanomma pulvis-pyrius CBS 109.77]|uniref:Uncharacterized protein n=1 Tax=Melanomma pulvis-pyrius CBS 109.77 TaxID=1314802 RepID=A0A6A6X3K1_9PLEO|nr:hypothetical protein K505DRAFT_364413 [Melanomma pulvis-pyrius CBS 109.77]